MLINVAPCAFPQEWLCLHPRAALRMRPLREPPWSTPTFRPSWSPPSAHTRCPSGPSWCLLEWSSWWGQRGFSERTGPPQVGKTALRVSELQSEKLPSDFFSPYLLFLCNIHSFNESFSNITPTHLTLMPLFAEMSYIIPIFTSLFCMYSITVYLHN